MKISKRTRSNAARLCSVMASAPDALATFGYWDVADWLCISRETADIAIGALKAGRANHAEAEALLRTGWSPP